MITRFLLTAILLVLAGCAMADIVPNPQLTPGATRSVDTNDLCTSGVAAAARSVTESVKLTIYSRYGMAAPRTGYCAGPHGCEIDHDISLELGGSNEVANLWPQPYDGEWNAHMKDKLENHLHALVCNGSITLPEAQRKISGDWRPAYTEYFGSPK